MSADGSAPFVLHIEVDDREWAEARGTIVPRGTVPATPPIPLR